MVGWIIIGLKWGPRGGGMVAVNVLDNGRIFTDRALLETRVEDTALEDYAQIHVMEVDLSRLCEGCECQTIANNVVGLLAKRIGYTEGVDNDD